MYKRQTCNALSYIGSHAVFLDVDRSTMGLSPDAMKAWLQKNAEVRKNTRIGEDVYKRQALLTAEQQEAVDEFQNVMENPYPWEEVKD